MCKTNNIHIIVVSTREQQVGYLVMVQAIRYYRPKFLNMRKGCSKLKPKIEIFQPRMCLFLQTVSYWDLLIRSCREVLVELLFCFSIFSRSIELEAQNHGLGSVA